MSVTAFYNQPKPNVNRAPAAPYVPVRARIAAPFLSAYRQPPAPVTPAQSVDLALAAEVLRMAQGLSMGGRLIAPYVRRGRPVRMHVRLPRLSRRVPDGAVEAQCARFDAHGSDLV